MSSNSSSVAVLGLGMMGRALVSASLSAGNTVTVWNRTPGKDSELVRQGATSASSAAEAIAAAPLVMVCLLDYESVRRNLEPLADALRGKAVVNLTSTTPDESRALAAWADRQGIEFLDGAILATPEMIGQPGAALYYSGPRALFDAHSAVFAPWGAAEYFGEDHGAAALYDFAMLAAMYLMFAGFYQATAMVSTIGVSATEFAPRVTQWLSAVTDTLPAIGEQVDEGSYVTDQQSLDFNKAAIDGIVRAARSTGVDISLLQPLRALVDRQVAAGHGELFFARIFESIARP